jgi:hypothetical protein
MKKSVTLIVFLALWVTACETRTPVAVDYPNICKVENNKKLVEAIGYLNIGRSTMCKTEKGDTKCDIWFYQNNPNDEKKILSYIYVGSGANTMDKLEGSYTPDSVKIRDNNNNLITPNDKVKITADVFAVLGGAKPGDISCILTLKKIEKQ